MKVSVTALAIGSQPMMGMRQAVLERNRIFPTFIPQVVDLDQSADLGKRDVTGQDEQLIADHEAAGLDLFLGTALDHLPLKDIRRASVTLQVIPVPQPVVHPR